MTDEEIEKLIDSKLNNKKNQFGKSYTELGNSTSNLILRTKGDVKIQWGGKYIDLIKNGKINAESELYIKKISSTSEIGNIKGIYITEDNKIYIGNSSSYSEISIDSSSFLSINEKQNLTPEQINNIQQSIGIIFEDEEALKNSSLQEGVVYLLSTSLPYLYKNQTLTPLIQDTKKDNRTEFNEIQVNKITNNDSVNIPNITSENIDSDYIKVRNLEVQNLNILSNQPTLTLNDDLIENYEFEDIDFLGYTVSGTIKSFTENTITLYKDSVFKTYQIIYYLDSTSSEPNIPNKSLICINYKDNINYLSFDPDYMICTILKSYINIPYINFYEDAILYSDSECQNQITFNTFTITGLIENSTIISNQTNFIGELNLQNCTITGNIECSNVDTTPAEILEILADDSIKEVFYENDCFHIKKTLPSNTLILCLNPDTPIESVTTEVTLPALEVKDSNEEVIGSTESITLTIPLTQILVNSTQYSWQLIQ